MPDLTSRESHAVDLHTVPIPLPRPGPPGWTDVVVTRRPPTPEARSREIGRRLRTLIGVDEEILDEVPEERTRYSCMAALVLAAGVMGTLSASVFLSKVGSPVLLTLPLALFWGLLILCIDRALVSSGHGVIGAQKIAVFVPRVVISILMGYVIAEPSLLFIFGPAIQTEARDERLAALGQYESHLKDCNPLNGEPPKAAGCEGEFALNVEGSPQTLVAQKAQTQVRRDDQQRLVDGLQTDIENRRIARKECNGTRRGDDTTGVVGVGPNCRRNRSEADNYRASSNVTAERRSWPTSMASHRPRSADRVGRQRLFTEVTRRIALQVETKRNNQSSIGILDENAALGALGDRSAYVLTLTWLVRLLLIAIDCMPVLMKLLNKATTYDYMLRRQLDMRDRVHDRQTTNRERYALGRIDVAMGLSDNRTRRELEDIDEARRATRSLRETTLDDQIEALAAKLRAGSETSRRHRR